MSAITVFFVEYVVNGENALYLLHDGEGAGETLLALAKQSKGNPIRVEAKSFTPEDFEELTTLLVEKAKDGQLVQIETPEMLPDYELKEEQ